MLSDDCQDDPGITFKVDPLHNFKDGNQIDSQDDVLANDQKVRSNKHDLTRFQSLVRSLQEMKAESESEESSPGLSSGYK